LLEEVVGVECCVVVGGDIKDCVFPWLWTKYVVELDKLSCWSFVSDALDV
jgi:hypothetical protein